MKKFKHKTTGYIATETNSEKNYKVSEPKNFTIPKWIVENSEDWEEVKEQEFEILEFISKWGIKTTFSKTYNLNLLPIYLNEGYKISKIRRLSDNEIFSIGDKLNRWEANIIRFDYNNGIIRVISDAKGKGLRTPEVSWQLKDCKKAPEPLFVTEDGVEVFEGDTVHWVNSNICNYLYSTKFSEFHPAILKGETIFKIFSTKEAAEKYINENKPIYSKKQIKEAFENSFVRENYILDVPCCCADRFKEELFMKKLGL